MYYAMPNTLNDLGRNIIGCSAERRRHSLLAIRRRLAHAEIGEMDMALRIQQDVIQLQITIDDLPRVEKLQCAYDLAGVEPGARLIETLHLLDMEHEVAAVQILHHEEEVFLNGNRYNAKIM